MTRGGLPICRVSAATLPEKPVPISDRRRMEDVVGLGRRTDPMCIAWHL